MYTLRARTLSFDHENGTPVHHERGAVVVDTDGKIAWAGSAEDLPDDFSVLPVTDYGKKLLMPGFVDPHLHFPQYRMLATCGEDLLDWLNRYTFVEEQRYDDRRASEVAASFFLDELIRNGTTGCLTFSTVHPEALEALFSEAVRRKMAVISGLTLMDRNAPEALRNDLPTIHETSIDLIEKYHGKGRLGYAISPRFAITASEALLEICQSLVTRFPGLPIQTHLSENLAEIALTEKLFPWARDYLAVYERYDLVRSNSLFAHGIHLSESESRRLASSDAAIVHCPTSNNFLGSGLFPWLKHSTSDHPIRIGLGSDIGGGTSYSMLATMRDAYVVSQLAGRRIDPSALFRTATRENAELIGRLDRIGSLEAGKFADMILLDPQATPLMAERSCLSESLEDLLFALIILGDDRAVAETFIAGQPVKTAMQ
jgi:guanine deaminase